MKRCLRSSTPFCHTLWTRRRSRQTLGSGRSFVILDALVYNAGATLAVSSRTTLQCSFRCHHRLAAQADASPREESCSAAIIQLLALEPASLPPALQSNLAAFLVALATQLDTLRTPSRSATRCSKPLKTTKMKRRRRDLVRLLLRRRQRRHFRLRRCRRRRDVVDEDNEYLEMFARERAKLRARANGEEVVDDDDDDDEEGFFDDEDDEEDELSYESPMDAVPVFEQFRELLASYQISGHRFGPKW